MKAIFNFREINPTEPHLLVNNRAFCYGDGLFETIVTGPERIDLVQSHYDRLIRGADALNLELPQDLNIEYIKKSINFLAEANDINGNIRTKLIIWRKTGGLYSPENNEAEFYLECKSSNKPLYSRSVEIGVSQKYFNNYSSYSFAKKTNALQYVLAGHEMKEMGWNEVILLDNNDNLSETHIGNLVWMEGDEFFTPEIHTGCIEGVMRKAIIEAGKTANITIHEVSKSKKALDNASSILSINSSGLTSFKKYSGRSLTDPKPFLEPILKQLLLP